MGTGVIALQDRLSGAVWGHLVGEALGVPYEFRPAVDAAAVRFGARGSWDQPPGDPAYALPSAEEGKPGIDYAAMPDLIGAPAYQLAAQPVVLLSNFGGDGSSP
ncbi:MAG: hypothetical protein ABI725_00480 [Chloroflexota bacterium]